MDERFSGKRLYYIFLDVLSNIKWIFLSAVICAMVAFAVVKEVYVPLYTSSTTYIIKSKGATTNIYTSLVQATSTANTLDSVLGSEEFKQVILDRTGWEAIPASIDAMVISETNLLVISCTAKTPRDAFICLKEVMNVCPEMLGTITNAGTMTVFREPSVPSKPSNSSRASKIAIVTAAVSGLLMALVFAYISFLKKTIDDSKQLRDSVNTVLLQTVPYESRANLFYRSNAFSHKDRGMLINSFDCSPEYEESIKGIRSKINHEKKEGPLVIVGSSTLPNEGKSTIAANLALSLVEQGKKVALVDFDVYNSSLSALFPESVLSFNFVDDYVYSDKGYSEQVKIDSHTGIMMFFGKKTSAAKRLFPSVTAEKFINYLRAYADYIIIDTPPISLFADSSILTDFADISYLVVREHYAVEGQISESILTLKSGKADFIGCIYNGERFGIRMQSVYGYGYGYGRYGYGKYGYGKYGETSGKEDAEDE